jgi:hypothetical protein
VLKKSIMIKPKILRTTQQQKSQHAHTNYKLQTHTHTHTKKNRGEPLANSVAGAMDNFQSCPDHSPRAYDHILQLLPILPQPINQEKKRKNPIKPRPTEQNNDKS